MFICGPFGRSESVCTSYPSSPPVPESLILRCYRFPLLSSKFLSISPFPPLFSFKRSNVQPQYLGLSDQSSALIAQVGYLVFVARYSLKKKSQELYYLRRRITDQNLRYSRLALRLVDLVSFFLLSPSARERVVFRVCTNPDLCAHTDTANCPFVVSQNHWFAPFRTPVLPL